MAEGIRVQTCGATWCSGNKGKSSMVVDDLASSLIWSQGGDCCESDSKLEKLKFAEAVKSEPDLEKSESDFAQIQKK